jgi:hypothetical protein
MKTTILIIFLLIQLTAFGQKSNSGFLLAFSDTSSGKELYGFRTIRGEIIIKPKYEFISTDTMYNIAFVISDNKWVAINRRDSIILTPYIYDNGPDYIEEGLFRFEENNKVGFANLKGLKVINATFDFAAPFKNGLAAFNVGGHKENTADEHSVWSGGLWGFINKKGNVIIGPKFINVDNFNNKYAEVWTQDNQHVLIDKKGQTFKVLK